MVETEVLLVDDHTLVVDGLREILRTISHLKVVGEAADGLEAVAKVERLEPDLVLMDIRMPRLSGIAATRQICDVRPQMKVIMLSFHDETRFVVEAMRAGASGYIVKTSAAVELVAAVEAVCNGRKYISPEAADGLLDELISPGRADLGALEVLSAREREVLQGIAEGKSSREIGESLHISPRTVETHRTNMMRKLRVGKAAGLVRIAFREGLVG